MPIVRVPITEIEDGVIGGKGMKPRRRSRAAPTPEPGAVVASA